MTQKFSHVSIAAIAACLLPQNALAAETSLEERLETMEREIRALQEANRELRAMLGVAGASKDETAAAALATAPLETVPTSAASTQNEGTIGLNAAYSYAVLDHAEDVTTKQALQLQAKQTGALSDKVTLGGGLIVLANAQRSNREDKFGYLMRNPTSANQIGKDVSEAVVHSAQLQATAQLTDYLTAYTEFLYNPQQSFGSGTITTLDRNQVQVRRAYLLLGDLDKSPLYAAIGKMDTPFGFNDTVSPFTNSTVWHSFAGLAYGAKAGYFANGLHVQAMAIQGGAQFRAANSEVKGTNVPSRINNFAVDANYTLDLSDGDSLMAGASYQYGSAYCQDYPVFHFDPCAENNPAYSVYGKADIAGFSVIGEFAQTTEEWPGSAVPDLTNPLSVFEAEKTKSWGIGGRYEIDTTALRDFYVSAEFSRFVAGDEGAPWERQDQWVGGLSYFHTPSINLFAEYIHVDGFAPLNFLSGGNFPDGSTWSDRDAKTDVVLLGVQTAF